jgi:2-polyprenyl-6-methoxyphenol hydroxylase-like FAD-dependent oxidoreductase
MKIGIIGGGISGLALANCFQHFSIPYTLFEKSHQFGEVGAGIGISESANAILKKIGLGDEIKSKGYFVEDTIIVNKDCETIRKLPIKNGGFCIHRAELINILSYKIDNLNVKFDANLIGFVTKRDNVELTFKNGIKEEFDYVFACDGINSIFRRQLFPQVNKRYSGQTIWRGISTCKLPVNYHSAYLEFWGENLRFATIPLNKTQYYWYACKVSKESIQDNKATLKTDLKNLFKEFCEEVSKVIDTTELIIRNDMWDLKPHNESWYKSNVVFLGDAIHATTPNLAQGGCQAIEDAFTLSKLIHAKGFSLQTFEYYQKLRNGKVNYIVKQSWNYGKISHQNNLLIEFIVKSIFKYLPNRIFEKQYEKLIDLSYLNKAV